jgi:hypothetical protein
MVFYDKKMEKKLQFTYPTPVALPLLLYIYHTIVYGSVADPDSCWVRIQHFKWILIGIHGFYDKKWRKIAIYLSHTSRPLLFYTYIIFSFTAVLRIRIHSGSGLRIQIQHFKWILIGMQGFYATGEEKPSALKENIQHFKN